MGGGYILPFNLLCFGVPCFLMITGKLQLDKQEYSMSKCLKKVVIPLLFWGVVFALMEIVFDERNIQIEYIFTAFYKVLTGQSWAHLWYLYMLVGIYLALPLVRCVVKNTEYDKVGILILVLFVFNSLIMDLFKFATPDHSFAVQLPITSQYIMYILLGWYLDKLEISKKKLVMIDFVGVLMMVGTSLLGYRVDSIQYNDVPTVILSVCVFLTFRYFMNQPTDKITNFLVKKSYGIYILHMVFVNSLYKLVHFNPWKFNIVPVSWLIASLLIFLASTMLTVIIQRLPGGKKVVP